MSQKKTHVPVSERRVQLTVAAMQVMRRDGAPALTVRAVAQEAGVPLGAVHYAFASKQELISSVFAADVESATVAAHGALQAGGTPQEVIARALLTWRDALRADPWTEAALQELTFVGVRETELAQAALQGIVDYRENMARFMTALAQQSGRSWSVSTEVLAEMVFAQFIGLSQNWIATGDDDLLDACVELLIEQVTAKLA